MKVAAKIYDFIAGGSVAAPIGLAAALAVAYFGAALAPGTRALSFFATLLLTFFASTLERAR